MNDEPNTDNEINNQIIENFENEKFENIPYSDYICYTCQIIRQMKSKHCRHLKACMLEYDHYNNFLNRSIGKGNHKTFVISLFVNYGGSLCYTYLYLVSLSKDIEYEYFSKFIMQNLESMLNSGFYPLILLISTIIFSWYVGWFLLCEVICISNALTLNEALNVPNYRYLYKQVLSSKGYPMLKFEDPAYKNIFTNWFEFFIN